MTKQGGILSGRGCMQTGEKKGSEPDSEGVGIHYTPATLLSVVFLILGRSRRKFNIRQSLYSRLSAARQIRRGHAAAPRLRAWRTCVSCAMITAQIPYSSPP